jgi:hypothetical protein
MVLAFGDWFANAEVYTPNGTRPATRYPQLSDWYAGAHSAPEVVTIKELDWRLYDLAEPYGGLHALAGQFGIPEQALRDVAYLTAAIYGMSFTLANLDAMRRLGDTLEPLLGRAAVLYSDLELLVRAVRNDDDIAPRPVDPGQIQVLADLLGDSNGDPTLHCRVRWW